MCGDLEEDAKLDDALLALLRDNAAALGATAPGAGAGHASVSPATPEYMGEGFRIALARVLDDVAAAPAGGHADAIRSHAIVLARLAGFLAGHLPPGSDLFRDLVDALVDGSRATERSAEGRANAHSHGANHHGHSHDH